MNPKNNFTKTAAMILGLIAFSCNTQNRQDYQVTAETLLNEMIDRDALAKTSDIPFKMLQASSYSDKAKSPDSPGWFDNADSRTFAVDTTQKGKEYTIVDLDGPGAIVRFWSTWNPQLQYFTNGTLRVYIDHAEAPELEGKLGEIISSNPYVGEPLSQEASPFLENGKWYAGHNLYYPITFAKNVKITYQKADDSRNDAFYFQINYRKYDNGIRVKSFQKEDWENGTYKDIIAQVNSNLLQNKLDKSHWKSQSFAQQLKAGETATVQLNGMQAIREFTLKLKTENLEQALRSTVLEMTFDGKPTVWVPVGDFFGTGYILSPYQSRYSQVKASGSMHMYFPMPFVKEAKISVHNFGTEMVALEQFSIQTSAWQWDEKSLYFHANWQLYPNIATKEKQDVNYINITGKGKHVGDALTLFNQSYNWWGEGDEKIYIDGESFPSHFGTGTEDYYGYAWCSVVDFDSPFNAQPIGDGNRSPGMTVNSRWRMLDVVPFSKSYKFDMELWHWDGNITMDYAPTVFWYGDKTAKAEVMESRAMAELAVKHADRFEGESFTVKNTSAGEVIRQAFLSHNWSAQNHLYWKDFKKGDVLEAEFYSEKERKGAMEAVFTNAPEYATVDVYLNGKLIFGNLDGYAEKLGVKKYTLKDGIIKKGKNSFKIVAKGTNTNNPKASEIGFDYLKIL